MKSLQRKLKNKKGFTLIELIVVIVILGVLAAIAIPKLSGFSDTAKKSADVATAKTIATAALTYYAETGKEPKLGDNTLNNYLDDTSPKAQSSGKDFVIGSWSDGDFIITDGTTTFYPAPQGESGGDGDGD